MNELMGQAQKKKGGCGKRIALGCVTVILLAVAGGFFAYRGTLKFVRKLTAEYTTTSPVELPVVEVSEQESAALLARVDTFARAVKEGVPGQEITLSSRDINVLIQKNPAWSSLAGKVFVKLEGDAILGEANIPLDQLGGLFKGRWLHGSGTFRAETAAGRLLVFMDALSVRGKPVPDRFIAGIRGKNLAEDATKSPETVALLQKLDSIKVREGSLYIKSK